MSLLIHLYRLILRIVQPLAYIVLPAGALLSPRWRQGWKQRLGFVPRQPEGSDRPVWVHAASVGEVETVWPLVKMLSERFRVVVSTLTPTGWDTARNKAEAEACLFFPIDTPKFVARSVGRITPRLIIIAETEMWPCFIYEAKKCGIPLVFVNARISDRTLRCYMALRPFFAPLINSASLIGVQGEEHAERFAMLGVKSERIRSFGNFKLDVDQKALEERAASLDAELSRFVPADKPLVVFASTHRGEEELLLPAISSTKGRALCVVTPRHPERANEVAALLKSEGLGFSLLSSGTPHPEVLVIDAIGKLIYFYARSAAAFVGGSLTPIGGHNMAEPAALGKPTLFGPHVSNFREPARILLDSHGAIMVESARELASRVTELLDDPKRASDIGARARKAIEEHRGATEKTYRAICDLLGVSTESEPA